MTNPQGNQPTGYPQHPAQTYQSDQTAGSYQQQPATYPGDGHQHRHEPQGTTVCGIVGLVFGALGFVLSFIPIINNVAAIFGALGVILSIVGIVGTFRGKKRGKALSIIAAVLSVLAIVITLSMQAAAGKAIDEITGTESGTAAQGSSSSGNTANPSEQTTASGVQDIEGDLKSAHVKIASAVRSNKDDNGAQTILVTYEWKNNTDKNNSFMVLVNAQAFQNGQALDMAIYTNNPAGYDPNSALAEVQPGATGTATLGYVLKDASPVTVELTDQFSLDDAKKVSHTCKL